MNHEQYQNFKDEMKEHLEMVIQSKVNGKIDKISTKLDTFIVRAEPAVRLFENLTWFKKVIIGIAVFIATLATGMTVIQQVIAFVNRTVNK